MPRQARAVFPLVPHHVTQRGNRRRDVFFGRGDALAYLNLLQDCASRHGIEVAAYCLMPNHVHLVVVPSTADGLHRALKVVHGRHAQRVNRMRRWTGHLWQNRYFSSPLDSMHFLTAIRSVELNPVRAGIVDQAANYAWSSAAAHCGLRDDKLIVPRLRWPELEGIADWAAWLAVGAPTTCMELLRRNASQNLPCGTDDFVAKLEAVAGRALRYQPPGRPRQPAAEHGASCAVPEKVSVPFRKRGRSASRKGDRPL
jgi:putative transposase